MQTAEFWLTAPRYLKQVGEEMPQYINASPSQPVKVVLPAKLKRESRVKKADGKGYEVIEKEVDHPEDAFMRRAKPDKPKPAYVETKRDPVKKSHEPKATSEVRAADK